MNNDLIIFPKLEKVLLSRWAEFINKSLLIRKVLEDTQHSTMKIINRAAPTTQTKISLTKFYPFDNIKFEIWVEFAIPHQNGMAIGTHVYLLGMDQSFELKETYGTIFTESQLS